MHTTRNAPTRQLVTRIAVLALLAATAACEGDGEDAADGAPSDVTTATSTLVTPTSSTSPVPPTSTSAAELAVSRIPDGRYERVITRSDAERLGIDPTVVDLEATGDEYHVAIEVDGDRWRQLGGASPDLLEVGDEGRAEYDDEGNWVTTSESAGCPGCTVAIGWTIDGDTLMLTAPADIDDPFARLIIDGTYSRAGSQDEAITLSGFLDFVPPQVVEFLDAVDAADTPVDITADMSIGYQLSEDELLDAVAEGELDMAFVGARAFPRFDALLAPFLVDSYELQEAVFEAGIPQAMLVEIGREGVVGVAVVPGPFRKIMGVDRTIDQAGDMAGALVNTDDTPLAAATFDALGATAVPGGAIDEVNAFAIQLQAIPGNGYEADATSVTANLNMWPRSLVIVMNADTYASLTPDQQAVLADAAATAIDAGIAVSTAEDTEALESICPSPMKIIQMPDTELNALMTLVEPVLADLRQDPQTATELDAIKQLKNSVAATPDTFACE